IYRHLVSASVIQGTDLGYGTRMPTADYTDISGLLKGRIPVGTHVNVRGWVRTRRDSKAGLSFIHLHDGSCFDPIHIVAANQLPNYESALRKLATVCAMTR